MEKAKQQIIENCEAEIAKGEIYIGFYKAVEKTQDKETAGKTALKRMQVEDAVSIAKSLLKYVQELK